MSASIYVLIDPLLCRIRYVGQSVDLAHRYQCHLTTRNTSSAVNRWIKSLRVKPVMFEFAKVPVPDAAKREQEVIDFFRAQGADLLNEKRAAKTSYGSACSNWVRCIQTGQIYDSYSAAARARGCSDGTIANRVKAGEEFELVEPWTVEAAKPKTPKPKKGKA